MNEEHVSGQIGIPLDEPVAHARRTDPSTSHAAAASVSGITKTQENILALFALVGPMPDFTLVGKFHAAYPGVASDAGIRSRRAELVAAGKLYDTEERVRMPSGRWAIVWGRM